MNANALAPLMTSFQQQFNLSLSVSSLIPFLNTAGVISANFIGGFLIAHTGLKNFMIISLSLGITGTMFFVFANSFLFLILGSFFIGAGTGAAFMSMSSIYSHLDEKYQNYGLFHAFFGFGGIISPLLVSLIIKFEMSYKILYAVYAFLLFIILIYILISNIIENRKYDSIKLKEAFKIITKKIVFIPLLIFMLYAGSEIGIVTWSGNLFIQEFHYSKEFSSLLLSAFWIIYTIGRILTDFVDKKLGALKTISIASLSVIFSIIMLITTKNFIFFILLGIFLSTIFPILQKYSSRMLPKREVGLFSGLIFGSTGIGTMILSTSMGVIGDFKIILSYFIPVIAFFIIFILTRWLTKETKKM
jgi:fucose permease